MGDITNLNFTINRRSSLLLFEYNNEIFPLNINDNIIYELYGGNNIRVKSMSSNENIIFNYTNCTNFIANDIEEFKLFLRYLLYTKNIQHSNNREENSDVKIIVIRGRNDNVGNTEETVWNVGGLWSRLENAEIMNITSSSVNDTNITGTGAHIVLVSGLDSNYDEISEEINLNGLTTVVTTNQYLIIHEMKLCQTGSAKTNIGSITAVASISGTIQCQISANESISKNGFYIVPNKRRAKILVHNYNVRRLYGIATQDYPLTDFITYITNTNGIVSKNSIYTIDTNNQSFIKYHNDTTIFYNTGTCIEFRTIIEGSTGNRCTVDVSLLLDYSL